MTNYDIGRGACDPQNAVFAGQGTGKQAADGA